MFPARSYDRQVRLKTYWKKKLVEFSYTLCVKPSSANFMVLSLTEESENSAFPLSLPRSVLYPTILVPIVFFFCHVYSSKIVCGKIVDWHKKREDDLLITERGCPGPIYTLPIPGDMAHAISRFIIPLF